MKKGIFILLMVSVLAMIFAPQLFADRDVSTTVAYTSTTLIKRGDWKIYRISFVASANGGCFTIYDTLDGSTAADSNVKTEGSEATSGNGKPYDFTNKPLEGSTGLYLYINDAKVVVEYE